MWLLLLGERYALDVLAEAGLSEALAVVADASPQSGCRQHP